MLRAKKEEKKLGAKIERFNRTLEEEFLQMGNYIDDLEIFNLLLTEWLVEYNFNRPHRSLDYLTPEEYYYKYWVSKLNVENRVERRDPQLLPMY